MTAAVQFFNGYRPGVSSKMTVGKRSKKPIDMDSITAELSGSDEHGFSVRHQPLPPIKSNLGGVLFNANPACGSRLKERLHELNNLRNRRKHALEWNQTQFFASQVFDNNEKLSFSKKDRASRHYKEFVQQDNPSPASKPQKTSPQRKGIFGLTQPAQSTGSDSAREPKHFLPQLSPRNVVSAPCSDELINRLITTLPPRLLKKANDAINVVVSDEKRKLIEQNKATSQQTAVDDIRFKRLEDILIRDKKDDKDILKSILES